jgi:hypothetical protein
MSLCHQSARNAFQTKRFDESNHLQTEDAAYRRFEESDFHGYEFPLYRKSLIILDPQQGKVPWFVPWFDPIDSDSATPWQYCVGGHLNRQPCYTYGIEFSRRNGARNKS